MESVYIIMQQIYSGNGVPHFIKIVKFYRRYYQKYFGLFFFWTHCILCMSVQGSATNSLGSCSYRSCGTFTV